MRSFCTAMVLSLALAVPAGAQEIGKVASIQPHLTGTVPGQSAQALAKGTAVHRNERIEAKASGRGQLLFKDSTTLTVAPNSSLVLDEFVYSPGGGDGKLALSLTRGALRLIGGQATRQQGGLIQTPAATVGIRGSSVLVMADRKRTSAIFLMGERMCVGQVCTSRRGGLITSDGGYQGVVPMAQLAQILERIDGEPPAHLRRTGKGGGLVGNVGPWTPVRSTTGASMPQGALDQGVGGRLDQATVPADPLGGDFGGGCGIILC